MSAVGTTLLHSPGWRECQRHEQNPGYTQTTNNMSSVGAALSARVFVVGCAAPHRGSINVRGTINPGLAPWAMQEYRPKGLFYDKFKINVNTSYLSQ